MCWLRRIPKQHENRVGDGSPARSSGGLAGFNGQLFILLTPHQFPNLLMTMLQIQLEKGMSLGRLTKATPNLYFVFTLPVLHRTERTSLVHKHSGAEVPSPLATQSGRHGQRLEGLALDLLCLGLDMIAQKYHFLSHLTGSNQPQGLVT